MWPTTVDVALEPLVGACLSVSPGPRYSDPHPLPHAALLGRKSLSCPHFRGGELGSTSLRKYTGHLQYTGHLRFFCKGDLPALPIYLFVYFSNHILQDGLVGTYFLLCVRFRHCLIALAPRTAVALATVHSSVQRTLDSPAQTPSLCVSSFCYCKTPWLGLRTSPQNCAWPLFREPWLRSVRDGVKLRLGAGCANGSRDAEPRTCLKEKSSAWPSGSVGRSIVLWTMRSWVRFLVKGHTQVGGLILGRAQTGGNQSMFLSHTDASLPLKAMKKKSSGED